jgi:hypothetical protein
MARPLDLVSGRFTGGEVLDDRLEILRRYGRLNRLIWRMKAAE